MRTIREMVEKYRSVLIFTNTRTEAEALASRFRVWDPTFPIGIHHSSLSKATREAVERELKDGRLFGVICTSSLELGIDIGFLDYVIQYNSPRQVTRLIQRIGRSGHRVGQVSNGLIITQDSDDVLEAARAVQEGGPRGAGTHRAGGGSRMTSPFTRLPACWSKEAPGASTTSIRC